MGNPAGRAQLFCRLLETTEDASVVLPLRSEDIGVLMGKNIGTLVFCGHCDNYHKFGS